jgi:hypothetical protein
MLSTQTNEEITRYLVSGNRHTLNNIVYSQGLHMCEFIFDSSQLELMDLDLTGYKGKYGQIVWFIILHLKRIGLLFFNSAQRFLLL